jgi:hypothetical protein
MSIFPTTRKKSVQYPQQSSAQAQFPGSLYAEKVLNFGSTNAQLSADLEIPCPGAKKDDFVIKGFPAPLANTCYDAFVAEDGVVTVRLCNFSASSKNPASALFRVIVVPAK